MNSRETAEAIAWFVTAALTAVLLGALFMMSVGWITVLVRVAQIWGWL